MYTVIGIPMQHAPVAQLDRVFGYEPKGQGFESLLACQCKPNPNTPYFVFVGGLFGIVVLR